MRHASYLGLNNSIIKTISLWISCFKVISPWDGHIQDKLYKNNSYLNARSFIQMIHYAKSFYYWLINPNIRYVLGLWHTKICARSSGALWLNHLGESLLWTHARDLYIPKADEPIVSSSYHYCSLFLNAILISTRQKKTLFSFVSLPLFLCKKISTASDINCKNTDLCSLFAYESHFRVLIQIVDCM